MIKIMTKKRYNEILDEHAMNFLKDVVKIEDNTNLENVLELREEQIKFIIEKAVDVLQDFEKLDSLDEVKRRSSGLKAFLLDNKKTIM